MTCERNNCLYCYELLEFCECDKGPGRNKRKKDLQMEKTQKGNEIPKITDLSEWIELEKFANEWEKSRRSGIHEVLGLATMIVWMLLGVVCIVYTICDLLSGAGAR